MEHRRLHTKFHWPCESSTGTAHIQCFIYMANILQQQRTAAAATVFSEFRCHCGIVVVVQYTHGSSSGFHAVLVYTRMAAIRQPQRRICSRAHIANNNYVYRSTHSTEYINACILYNYIKMCAVDVRGEKSSKQHESSSLCRRWAIAILSFCVPCSQRTMPNYGYTQEKFNNIFVFFFLVIK